MITVKNLKKEYRNTGTAVKAVDGVSFSVPTGSFATIVGKSGSGKSTLLSLLGALDVPDSGEITMGNSKLSALGEKHLIDYRRNQIGFVFQAYNLVPNLTALENVVLPMEFAKREKSARRKRAAELLNQVGLDESKHDRKPSRLSGGEQQRVAIARALANEPDLILADEPTGNLDSQTGKIIVDLMKKLAKNKKVTVIVVTHDNALQRRADRAFRLKDGRLTSS